MSIRTSPDGRRRSPIRSFASIATRPRRSRGRRLRPDAPAGANMYVANGKRLTYAGAREMMTVATRKAHESGVAVSVAIVDAGGHLILLERMEGGRFHTG